MSKAVSNRKTEAPEDALRHFSTKMPYRAVAYARLNGTTPLYWVAGIAGGPWGAENALRKAHEVHKGECFYCDKTISDGEFSIDHIEPQVGGGQNGLHNLVISHKVCNGEKGKLPIDAYRPDAGKAWLELLLVQVQDRLNRLA